MVASASQTLGTALLLAFMVVVGCLFLYVFLRWIAEDVVVPVVRDYLIDPFTARGTGGLRLGWGVVGFLVLAFGLIASAPVVAVIGLVIVGAMVFAHLRVRQ